MARSGADPEHIPRYGELLLVQGSFSLLPQKRNPGGFDYRAYLDRSEVRGALNLEHVKLLQTGRGDWLTSKVVIPARQYIRSLADKFLQGDEAALLLGLTLGERSGLSARVQEAFSNTGTTHVLAVSGLHVVLVAFILFLAFRIVRVSRRWAAIGTCAGLVFYTLLTGSPPSIVRATIMAVAVLLGGMFERQGNGLNMLGLAGLLILFFWPQSLFDVGFQLSFAATAGILAVTRPIQNQLYKITENEVLREWLLLPLAVSLAAQIFTAPFLAYHFHKIPTISLLANLVVVPATNLLLALGLLMAILYPLGNLVAWPLAASAYAASWVSLKSVELFNMIKFSVIVWPRPDLSQILIYSIALIIIFNYNKIKRIRFVIIIFLLAVLNVFVWAKTFVTDDKLKVTFLDVGHGDAAFIQFPNGRTMLIDAGPSQEKYDSGQRIIHPFLKYLGQSTIDLAIITHGDADHVGGFSYLLSRVKIKKLMISGHQSEQSLFVLAMEAAVKSKTDIDTLWGYDTLSGIAPVRGFVFCQRDSAAVGNEASIVCFIQYGQKSFLFTGDMGPQLADTLYSKGLLPKCTVLKVPHHGSHINNSPAVIRAISPELAVIQVGQNNRFGHPSPEVVEGYKAVGSVIYRTDEQGAIVMETDGRKLEVKTTARHFFLD
ncbi:DNA internalization-related competence protein ComEC/Rec2 [candidate division TA06 bacterium]|uniref:DNA internalization-related competence protein ComEC/Rec2 n=1 Tax=candidate division TA06 bacterium TaxID=2250710 RepID=A0A933MJY1_UNCT6|nr:DNA internalization-related competence protein ComEC/Rec2 [candidate division TA06 bacterium]